MVHVQEAYYHSDVHDAMSFNDSRRNTSMNSSISTTTGHQPTKNLATTTTTRRRVNHNSFFPCTAATSTRSSATSVTTDNTSTISSSALSSSSQCGSATKRIDTAVSASTSILSPAVGPSCTTVQFTKKKNIVRPQRVSSRTLVLVSFLFVSTVIASAVLVIFFARHHLLVLPKVLSQHRHYKNGVLDDDKNQQVVVVLSDGWKGATKKKDGTEQQQDSNRITSTTGHYEEEEEEEIERVLPLPSSLRAPHWESKIHDTTTTVRGVQNDQIEGNLFLSFIEDETNQKQKYQLGIISGGDKSFYQRVYFRANVEPCNSMFGSARTFNQSDDVTKQMIFPMFDDGYSAGPIISCPRKEVFSSQHMNNHKNETTLVARCDPVAQLKQLDTIKELTSGNAMQFQLPHQPIDAHNAIVLDRPRRSSATGVVFLNEKHMIVASYGMQKIYLYEYCFRPRNDANPCQFTKLLAAENTTGNPDLIDFDGKNMLVASQLMRGTQELYQVDLEKQSITKYKEVYAFIGYEGDKRQWCHEATFYPSKLTSLNKSSVIVASSSRVEFPNSIMIRFFDYENDRVIAEYPMDWNRNTRGFKAQGIRFIDDKHFIADVTSLVVGQYQQRFMCAKNRMIPRRKKAQGRLVLFRMNFSVEDILHGKQEPAGASDFMVLGTYDFGIAAVDGISYHDGLAIVADQLNDKVLLLKIDLTDLQQPIQLISEKSGYLMPHGVALSKTHMAVSCYGDNSVFIHNISNQQFMAGKEK